MSMLKLSSAALTSSVSTAEKMGVFVVQLIKATIQHVMPRFTSDLAPGSVPGWPNDFRCVTIESKSEGQKCDDSRRQCSHDSDKR